MAEGMNRVFLFGNLCADPEYRTTNGGTGVLKLRMATNERYLDKDKSWQERTEWHSCVIWGKRGEALSRILSKGSSVFVEGSLRTSSYEDKEGVKRYKTEIVASNVLLTGGKRDGGESAPRQRAEPRGYGPSAGEPAGGGTDDGYGQGGNGEDDIPFLSCRDTTLDIIANPRRRR